MNCELAEYGHYVDLLDEDAGDIDEKQYIYAGNKLDNFAIVKEVIRVGSPECILLTCDKNGSVNLRRIRRYTGLIFD